MPDVSTATITLADAGQRYLASISATARRDHGPEVNRFVRWFGVDRRLGELRGVDIERYAQEHATATDVELRLKAVRAFLSHLKKSGITEDNLSIHVRLRRTSTSSNNIETVGEDRLEVTADGLLVLQHELDSLRAERPLIAEALRAAMADKDFRENAPLDAAREHQAHVEARIRELDTMLKRAVVISHGGETRIARLGNRVRVLELQSNREIAYTLVGPGEVNANEGKISVSSPVGRALVDHVVGEEVDVVAPARRFRYRIVAIEA